MLEVVSLIVVFFICGIFSYLGKKLSIPQVVSLILAGLFISIPIVRNFIVGTNSELLTILGELGLLSLMFIAGLESSWQQIFKERRDAFIIASVTSAVSFLVGFLGLYLLGYEIVVALIFGIALSVTAEATRAKVLLDLKAMKTRVGAALMGAGIVDDLFGLILFSTLIFVVGTGLLYENILLVLAIFFFGLGMYSNYKLSRKHNLVVGLEKSLGIILIPFFFVTIGLNFNWSFLILSPGIILVVLILGFSGKFAGAFICKKFVNFDWKQLYLISWAMNSRGAVGLVLALIAYKAGLIPPGIYSSLVVLALMSTLIFPEVVQRIVKKNRKVLN